MKYAIIIPDGSADWPIDKLSGKTPLEVANIPNMDRLAKDGLVGLVQTIPDGFHPGSDIGVMSVLGINPAVGYTGRAPLEAAAMGIELADDEVAFRCNLVCIENDTMKDFSAGHIPTEEAKEIINTLNQTLSSENVKFYAGISYRHLLITKADILSDDLKTTPPHDIADKSIKDYLPTGKGAEFLIDLMRESAKILKEHPINQKRKNEGNLPATQIWLWGQGKRPKIKKFADHYNIKHGSAISAVDLVKGICKLIGWEIISVPGATGYVDTNYEGKGQYSAKALDENDIVMVHIEAPDEMGHNGDIEKKIYAIEQIDKFIVGPIVDKLQKFGNWRILVSPDHRTPIALKTHSREPVPFIIAGTNIEPNGADSFSEKSAEKTSLIINPGYTLMKRFIR